MKAPLSWIRDFVEINIPIEDLAHRLTIAGLEVEEIRYIGLPKPEGGQQRFKITGLSWPADKFVVAAIHEVMPHPNADRLVLCKLDDGEQIHTVLTGAPSLQAYKDKGPLDPPLKVAYAREGAQLYDGHSPGQVLTVLKRAKIRGVVSYSMVCSEKELGISDEAEDIIYFAAAAPTGTPLVDYIGDAVFDIAITPNFVRGASILGVAREVAAVTGAALRQPTYDVLAEGAAIAGRVAVQITEPEVNPRFALGLIENITIAPSPYEVQRRLRLAGMRPINNIVDATNYVMLEIGEPLHAFDYDILVQRARQAGQDTPTIITRRAQAGEKLTTLDKVERTLNDFTVLVCDQSGPLALAGVMGGLESEVTAATRTVLLEGAAWNMINTRRTVMAQNLPSEAAYRFARGIHPEMGPRGILRALEMMRQWSGGTVAQGLVDAYPAPALDPILEITPADVRRWLGIDLRPEEIAEILGRLEFRCEIQPREDGQTRIIVHTPDHRLDIGTGVVGKADLMEEIARIYGYERIPETRLADELPPVWRDENREREEILRDLLTDLGLQEVITHRMTSPEKEARLLRPGQAADAPYFRLANPINAEYTVMRRSLLASMMEVVTYNARLRERLALFAIGPVFLRKEGQDLPDEQMRLVIALSGTRHLPSWRDSEGTRMDFYDLKGVLEAVQEGLHLPALRYEPADDVPTFHPGKCARVWLGERAIGVLGEMHPVVRENFADLPTTPLLLAEIEVGALLTAMPRLYATRAVPVYPPVLEDLAVIVDEGVPAAQVAEAIRSAGAPLVTSVRLFDVYRGAQIGAGKKSLAYSVSYQDPERTLTDKNVAKVRNKIVKYLEQTMNARLRS
ncbi:MAG: phenylalanine--tRNA ligase subunit beta [Anaerolineales bacterium]